MPTDFRRPESVLVVVCSDDRQVLLLRRRRPFEFWQSVTGSLLPGETHEEAARRELMEETGLADEGRLQYSG
ncbi:MAG: NUDIX domain-containing protein, partial [Gammaproteobacteria bacterium]|nr:NUDIX domain-containing protein [Gammaproteobacteria bacterium]